MANLLYAGFRKGCYVGWSSSAGDYEPGSYCYGYGDYMASYYADLKPNTTYTIQRIDSSTRFRLGLSSSDLKMEVGEQQQVQNAFSWGYRADSSDTITFTTGASDTHLVVYYTNNSEYSTRVMLNEGSTIQPYEAPTVPLPNVGWVIQNGDLTHTAFVNVPDEPFHGDSPYTMWRIDTNTNGGMPYVPLMIGVPVLAPEPPPPMYIQPSRPLIHVYGSRETNFNGNGYAIIEPISCTVYQEENGAYEAKFETYCDKYQKFKYLKKEALVKIPMRYHGEIIYQIFRVFKCNRIMDNYGNYRITATARHYFYELASRMIQDCRPTALGGNATLEWIFEHGWYGGNTDTGFIYSSDIGNIRTAYYQNCTVVAALLGVNQSFVNRWGGRLYRDNNYFSINTVMEGSKRSGVIMYSYNMTDIDFEEDDSDLITVLNAEDNYGHSVTITNPDVPSEEIPHHIYGYAKFNYDADDETAFLADAQEYYDEHKTSRINITVHFANLSDIKKYQQFLDLDDYEVGDKVMIYHKELDIYYSNLEIISKTYDVVAQKTAEIQVGSFKHAITRKN